MSKRKKKSSCGTMLDLWRPPQMAGDPVGCLTTTYTFSPSLFDEQCLARFLEIESEPNREDLAFLLERESCLGGVYAGVLVDYTRSGVEHSLRWDVLPVRIAAGKQHAKLSLLAWTHCLRIVVASANLTEPGYRANHEVAAAVDLTPEDANHEVLNGAVGFLRSLIARVPGAASRPPEVERANEFLNHVSRQAKEWKASGRGGSVRQRLVFTLPTGEGDSEQSSLESAVQECCRRGNSPSEAWVASPFFDQDEETSRVTAALCRLLARGESRTVWFCVPGTRAADGTAFPRITAPRSLIQTPPAHHAAVAVDLLPERDHEKNHRYWHAKMIAFRAEQYSALMIGSSNFTCAGMGVGAHRNTEANLLTIADRVAYSRKARDLEAIWPEMEHIAAPENADWLGGQSDPEDEEQPMALPAPAGFLSAGYRAGNERYVVLRLDPAHLPADWAVHSCGQEGQELISATLWHQRGQPANVELAWLPVQPPEKLLIRWADHEALLPINVEDSRELPPPMQLDGMSADDMLLILAAADPSAAIRIWTKKYKPSDAFDPEIDTAAPVDLDPLRRYDLQATFLHRIRRRAHILAQLRCNLQRPVHSRQALEWRLRGMVGIEPLADRLLNEFLCADGTADEALLTLADFLIVLREVDYQPGPGSLSKVEFEKEFGAFLATLAEKLAKQVELHRERVADNLMEFWERVREQCQR